ncbi:MAG: molybdenum ABC transporter ATP-binding protein [Spirochaetia bacterium]|jgi:molybdate transport system ATP-binding protein|nr:molybdenum ABC transporter ATP-binding protein [Spirochaetia bacterium]
MIDVNLQKSFGGFSIDVEFSVPETGITVLAGASGSGKTSIINMIAGLIKPDSGRISAGGRVFFDSQKKINLAVNKRRCGCVFQDGRLFPNMNVRKNLLYGAPGKSEELDAAVNLLGIEHLLERMPAKLSGGEKQRVSIGRALLMKPDILLMDEPLASLDSERKEELMRYRDKLPKRFSVPVVYVTHSQQEILRLSDELIRIENGRVKSIGIHNGEYIGLGTSEREEHVSVFECSLQGYDSESRAVIARFPGGVFLITAESEPPSGNFRAAVNASDVAVSLDEPRNISISNIFRGKIVKIEENNAGNITVHADIGTPLASYISRSSLARLGLSEGGEAYFLIKAVSLML